MLKAVYSLAPHLTNGSRRQRIDAAFALAKWFCAASFVSSVVLHYTDQLVSADLSGPLYAALGGLAVAVVVAFKAA